MWENVRNDVITEGIMFYLISLYNLIYSQIFYYINLIDFYCFQDSFRKSVKKTELKSFRVFLLHSREQYHFRFLYSSSDSSELIFHDSGCLFVTAHVITFCEGAFRDFSGHQPSSWSSTVVQFQPVSNLLPPNMTMISSTELSLELHTS